MTVILRDRINDLLVANADLEREVARLRYSDVQPVQTIAEPTENLEKTRYSKRLKTAGQVSSFQTVRIPDLLHEPRP